MALSAWWPPPLPPARSLARSVNLLLPPWTLGQLSTVVLRWCPSPHGLRARSWSARPSGRRCCSWQRGLPPVGRGLQASVGEGKGPEGVVTPRDKGSAVTSGWTRALPAAHAVLSLASGRLLGTEAGEVCNRSRVSSRPQRGRRALAGPPGPAHAAQGGSPRVSLPPGPQSSPGGVFPDSCSFYCSPWDPETGRGRGHTVHSGEVTLPERPRLSPPRGLHCPLDTRAAGPALPAPGPSSRPLPAGSAAAALPGLLCGCPPPRPPPPLLTGVCGLPWLASPSLAFAEMAPRRSWPGTSRELGGVGEPSSGLSGQLRTGHALIQDGGRRCGLQRSLHLRCQPTGN